MASVTSLNKERILDIERASVVSARIDGNNLYITKPGNVEILVGSVGSGSQSTARVIVTSPNMPRPNADFVIWIGGTVKPVNMQNGDIWFSEGAPTPIAPTISTTVLNTMAVGTAFNQTIAVTGSTPITFAVTSGSLPAGISLNTSSGVLSGNPTTTGAYNFSITATNSSGSTVQAYSGTVAAGGTAPTITTNSLAAMTQNIAYSQAMAASGSTPRTWGISAGTIPAGLSINSSTGVISGTPTGSGAYNFTVQVSNAFGTNTKEFAGSIAANIVAPDITTTSLGSLTQGVTFSLTLGRTGSTPITWAVTSGALPAGLSLNTSTGAVTGTPTGTGAYNVTISATNSAGSDSQTFTGTVAAPSGTAPNITTTALNTLTKGVVFAQTIACTGTTPITFSVVTGSLPAGLSLNTSTGAVTGTPTADGPYTFIIRASNSAGYDDQTFGGVVNPEPSALSVFGNTVPAVLGTYTDGNSGDWEAGMFYIPSGGTATNLDIVGARVYIPSGSSHIGQSWRAASIKFANIANRSFSANDFNTNGTLGEGSALVAGWNEVLINGATGVVNGESWVIGIQIGTGTRYLHNATLTDSSIQSGSGSNFYLAEMNGATTRSFYNGSDANVRWYGMDVLVRIN